MYSSTFKANHNIAIFISLVIKIQIARKLKLHCKIISLLIDAIFISYIQSIEILKRAKKVDELEPICKLRLKLFPIVIILLVH